MLDLSNNNGHVNFDRIHHAGQRRIYLKCSEGTHFHDPTCTPYMHRAITAGLKVGLYHFARPSQNSAKEEAIFFLRLLPVGWKKPGETLRACLDLEDPKVPATPRIGTWAKEWIAYVREHSGLKPIIYGSPSYLEGCAFGKVPCSLWLASYGRNDGKEHPFSVPKPWSRKTLAAHQFASVAHVAGVDGNVDISHVYHPGLIDIRRWSR